MVWVDSKERLDPCGKRDREDGKYEAGVRQPPRQGPRLSEGFHSVSLQSERKLADGAMYDHPNAAAICRHAIARGAGIRLVRSISRCRHDRKVDQTVEDPLLVVTLVELRNVCDNRRALRLGLAGGTRGSASGAPPRACGAERASKHGSRSPAAEARRMTASAPSQSPGAVDLGGWLVASPQCHRLRSRDGAVRLGR